MKIEDLAGAASRAEKAERLRQRRKARAKQEDEERIAKKDADYAPSYELARHNRAIYDRAKRLHDLLPREIRLGSISLNGIDEHTRDVQLSGFTTMNSRKLDQGYRYGDRAYWFYFGQFVLSVVNQNNGELLHNTLPEQQTRYKSREGGYSDEEGPLEDDFWPQGCSRIDFTLMDFTFADIQTAREMRGDSYILVKKKKRNKRLGQIAAQQDAFVETLELFEQAAADPSLNPKLAERMAQTATPQLSQANEAN